MRGVKTARGAGSFALPARMRSTVQRFGQGLGLAHQPALRVTAAEPVQDLTLLALLDAFGNEAAIERAGHRHDDADQRDPARPVERFDETLVELDLVAIESQQRAELGIARAEVVECDMHAGRVATRDANGHP